MGFFEGGWVLCHDLAALGLRRQVLAGFTKGR